MTVFVNSIESVNKAMKEINDFGSLGGPHNNWIKTQFMKLKHRDSFGKEKKSFIFW